MIYKYYSPRDYNFDSIGKRYFYMSEAKFMNDPYDITLKLLSKHVLQQIYGGDIPANFIENAMRDYKLCCFSQERDNKHLWALYADGYKGFCIGFDEKNFKNYPRHIRRPLKLVPVKYIPDLSMFNNPDTIIEFNDIMLQGEDNEHFHEKLQDCIDDKEKKIDGLFCYLCTIKEQKTWEIENEVRLITGKNFSKCPALKKKGLSFDEHGCKLPWYDFIKPKEVILGHNMTQCDKAKLIRALLKECTISETKASKPFGIEIAELKSI